MHTQRLLCSTQQVIWPLVNGTETVKYRILIQVLPTPSRHQHDLVFQQLSKLVSDLNVLFPIWGNQRFSLIPITWHVACNLFPVIKLIYAHNKSSWPYVSSYFKKRLYSILPTMMLMKIGRFQYHWLKCNTHFSPFREEPGKYCAKVLSLILIILSCKGLD